MYTMVLSHWSSLVLVLSDSSSHFASLFFNSKSHFSLRWAFSASHTSFASSVFVSVSSLNRDNPFDKRSIASSKLRTAISRSAIFACWSAMTLSWSCIVCLSLFMDSTWNNCMASGSVGRLVCPVMIGTETPIRSNAWTGTMVSLFHQWQALYLGISFQLSQPNC